MISDELVKKQIDADSMASEMDAKLLRTASTLREQKILPRIVEVGYGHYDFEIPQDYVSDRVKLARAVGISYDIESIGIDYFKLSSRVATLSQDPSIHGIRVSGWHLHRGEETYRFHELEPAKDIDCRTQDRLFQLLAGGSMFWEPTAGAIRRLIQNALAEKSLKETSIAVLGQLHEPAMKILAANSIFGTVVKSDSVRSENIELVRKVDVVVTSLRLHPEQFRQGQVIISRGMSLESPTADLIEMLSLMRAFATFRSIFTLATRVPFDNLLLGIIWRQGNLDPRSSSELARLLR